jgi:hypothetical protein
MLEGLDAVAWGTFHHAYGPADDVPDMLRSLASSDAKARESAMYNLYGNIWHQGTVYDATAHAVPFLIEIAAASHVSDREQVLAYLGNLSLGSSHLDAHQHMSIFAGERAEPDFDERLTEELGWVKAAREAVRAGAEVYAGLLKDANPPVRAGAAYLLGHFHEDAVRNAAWIRTAAETEADDMVRAAFALSSGLLADQCPETVAWLGRTLASDAGDPVRIASAIGLAWARAPDYPDAGRKLLTEAATNPGTAKEVFEAFPWEDSDVQLYAGQALACLGGDTGTSLPALIASMDNVVPAQSWQIARAMLNLVFAGKPLPEGRSRYDLTPDQFSALEAIATSPTFWRGSAENVMVINASEVLSDFGLPDRQSSLAAFLSGAN